MNHRHHPLQLAALTAGLAWGSAQAETDPWYLGASLSVTQLSNVFQAPGTAASPVQSDRLLTASLLAGFDQPMGRQRLYGRGTLSQNRFQNNSALSYSSFNVSLGMDWQAFSKLSGQAAVSRNRTLAPFNPGNRPSVTGKNFIDSSEASVSARYGLAGPLALEARLAHYEIDYSDPAYLPFDYSQNSLFLGLSYRVGPTLLLSAGPRWTRGRNPTAIQTAPGVYGPDDYTRRDFDLIAQWTPAPQHALTLRLSQGRSEHEQSQQRFSGLTGALDWSYQATAKLKLAASYGRDSGQDTGSFFGIPVSDANQLNTRMGLRADYALTAKIGLSASVHTATRDFDVRHLLGGNRDGSDRTTGYSLGAAWAATRNVQLGCHISRETRTGSSVFSLPYSGHSWGCYVQGMLR